IYHITQHNDILFIALSEETSRDCVSILLPQPITAVRRKSTSQTKTEPPLLRTCTHTIYTAGRPPWYDEHGAESKEAFVIGTTFMGVCLILLSVCEVLTLEEQTLALLVATVQRLKHSKIVMIPVYDFTTHGRQKDWKTVYGASVVIFEGIMSFADKELLELRDMKSIVDTDSDIRLVRRLRRDITERGRDIEGVIKQYNKFVKPAFEQYVEPYIQLADIVVPRGGGNMVAIYLIVQHVHKQMEEVSEPQNTVHEKRAPHCGRMLKCL
uniref:uridine/cytidine kinase n=1 Tax=Oncorhynchus tshawytscha TaxID=74940 RepID=A0A8C8I4A5_ONCTS